MTKKNKKIKANAKPAVPDVNIEEADKPVAYDVGQFNLEFDMRDPVDHTVEEEVYIPPIPPYFQLPLEVMQEASDLNTELENTEFKLIGRQLAGKVRDLHNHIAVGNATIAEAVTAPPPNLREPVHEFMQLNVRHIGNRFIEILQERISDFDESLLQVERVRKTPLPALWEPTLVMLANTGLLHVHLPAKGKKLSGSLWRLPDNLLTALGIRKYLPSPYTPEQLKRIELYERAIKIMEPLYSFGQEISTWTYVEPERVMVEEELDDE